MADPKVNILITATDKTKGVLSGIGGALGNLGKVAIGIGAAGLAAVGAGLAFSVKEAMEAQEVDAKLAAVLKATGGAAGVTAKMANDYANSLTKVTRFSDETIKSAETVLLRFKEIGKDTFPQATELALDLATALGTDASSAATMLGKALETPGEGLLRLKAAGVALSDEQIDLIQKMAESGDMAGAQKLIMDELTKSVGGMAEAAGGTFAGKMDIFKNALGNIGEAIGMKVLPLIQPLVDDLGKLANALLEGGLFSDQFKSALGEMVGDKNAEQIIATFKNIYDWLQVQIPIAIQTASAFWTNTLQPALAAVWNWMSSVLIPFLANVVWPWLATNIPIAVQFLSNVWNNVLLPAIQAVWGWMSTVLIPFLQNVVFPWLAENIPAAIATLSAFWNNTLLPALTAVWAFIQNNVIPVLSTIWTWLAENVPAAIKTLSDFWNNTLLPAITAVWSFFSTYIAPILTTVADIMGGVLSLAITALTGLWQNVLLPAITAIYNFVKDKLGPKFTWLKDNVITPLTNALNTGLKNALQWLLTKLQELKDKLANIKLPAWLTPGSPTPFELGLLGINDALGKMNGLSLPKFDANLSGLPNATVGAPGGGGGFFIGTQNITIMNGSDVDEIMETIAQANKQSMRTSGSFGYAG